LHVRSRMADWLLLSNALLGKSAREVEAMLGPQPAHDKILRPGPVYVLGPERGFISIDYEWLQLTLGKAATVERAEITRD